MSRLRSPFRSRGLLMAAFFPALVMAAGQPDIHVDASSTGPENGASWCTAFRELSDALAITQPGTTIRVAEGVYRPDTNGLSDSRTATFELEPGVVWLGGYAGCGQSNSVRNPSLNRTILSGDLSGNDVGGWDDPSRADNAYHVVTSFFGDVATELDGFTIMGGHADGPVSTQLRGGGMVVCDGAPVIRHTSFQSNYATNLGGGFHLCSGSATVSFCDFEGNRAGIQGGGLHAFGSGGDLALVGTSFVNNTADMGGGAYLNGLGQTSEIQLDSFQENRAKIGGGLYVRGGQVELARVNFLGNEAMDDSLLSAGGGIYIDHATVSIVDGVIFGNVSRAKQFFAEGGGIFSVGSTVDVTDTAVVGNRSEGRTAVGGGMFSWESDLTLTNALFGANLADFDGGALHLQFQSTLDAKNITMVENEAGRNGGGIYVIGGSHAGLADSIVWGNVADGTIDEVAQLDVASGTSALSTTCLEGWSGGPEWGNIADDPRFVAGGAGGCVYLAQIAAGQPMDSPCVDTGGVSAAVRGLEQCTTRTDQTGDQGPVDMGFHSAIFAFTIPIGDWDRDRRISLADVQGLQACMSEPTADTNCVCRIFDFDVDGAITLTDVGAFVDAMEGP